MNNIPIPDEVIESLKEATGIKSPGTASIREIVSLVNRIEQKTGIPFVRMEMGVPGIPAPAIGTEAEIEALHKGVASLYPEIAGLRISEKRSIEIHKALYGCRYKPCRLHSHCRINDGIDDLFPCCQQERQDQGGFSFYRSGISGTETTGKNAWA